MEERLTATQLAAENDELRARLIDIFSTDDFYVYPSSDLLGTQLAGAMKNVYAIAYGIADGSKDASVNFTATLVTRISAEIKTLALAMGADPETFDTEGQAWMADFLATARGGRNSEFGKTLVRWPVPDRAEVLQGRQEERRGLRGDEGRHGAGTAGTGWSFRSSKRSMISSTKWERPTPAGSYGGRITGESRRTGKAQRDRPRTTRIPNKPRPKSKNPL